MLSVHPLFDPNQLMTKVILNPVTKSDADFLAELRVRAMKESLEAVKGTLLVYHNCNRYSREDHQQKELTDDTCR